MQQILILKIKVILEKFSSSRQFLSAYTHHHPHVPIISLWKGSSENLATESDQMIKNR